MSLIKWTPLFADPFDDLDKAFGDFLPAIRSQQEGFTPAVDIYEDEKNIIVEAQLAGIDPEQVNVSIENDTLCIKGQSEKHSEVDDKNYYRKEIRRGSFYRAISLPAKVNGTNAKSLAESGVLKIPIPKAESAEAKNIKIETKK